MHPLLPRSLCLAALALPLPSVAAQSWESAIVYEGGDGRLVYASDDEGNRIPDFSHAGYQAGGVPLPIAPTLQTVGPVEGDDTAAIQAAIDAVSAAAPGPSGLRGAVQLEPGTYQIEGTLTIRTGGVVLRGAGDDPDPLTNTVLQRGRDNQAPVVLVGREEASSGDAIIRRDTSRPPSVISDDLVPIGSRSFDLDNPERFQAGDEIVIYHPAVVAWINAVDGGGTASDPPWSVGDMPIAYVRTATSVEGATMTVDAPVFTKLDKSLSPSYIYVRDRVNVIEEVGIESLRIDIETASGDDETQARNAVEFQLVENGWVRDVTALHFWHAGVSIQNSRYVTVRESRALAPHSQVTGERRYNFEVARSQLVLFEGNEASQARHAYVGNGETLDSGIVFLDNRSDDAYTSSEAHRRWSTGFLFDNHTETGGPTNDRRIHLGNRGDFGTGHGWACAHCVAWNCTMESGAVVVEKPPTAQNYAIGTQGRAIDNGPFLFNTGAYIEGTDQQGLAPQSLYRRQLLDRVIDVTSETGPRTAGALLLPAAPNPVRDLTRIGFDLTQPGHVRLALYDVLGREAAVLADGPFAAGRHDTSLDTSGLSPGVYLYHLTVSGVAAATSASRRLTIVR